MFKAELNTSYISDQNLSINDSFLKSDIANIISKMYTPVGSTTENLTAAEIPFKVENSNKNELEENHTKPVGFICKTDMTVSNITPVVDSSTSDSVSLPRAKTALRSFRVVCECCKRKITSRVVEKRIKTACTGCRSCMKNECLNTEQITRKLPLAAQSYQNNQGQGDCSHIKKDYSLNYFNHVKKMHEDCEICQTNLEYLKVNNSSMKLPESESISYRKVSNTGNPSKADEVWNSLNPSENISTTHERTYQTANSSKNIKPRSKSLFTIFKLCGYKESSSGKLSVDDKIGLLEGTESKLSPNRDEGDDENGKDNYQERELNRAEGKKDICSGCSTSVNISVNEIHTKRNTEWNQFWFDFFKPARQVLAFFSGFVLTLLEFLLDSLVRPLLWGSLQIVCKYFFHPCLETVFYSILQPIFVLLTNIASSTRDLFLPVAECFGYFVKEFSTSCRACKMVEEPKANITPEEIISKH